MSILYQPVAIGTMTVKNRFVRSATNDNLGHSDGTLSEAEFTLYRTLAQHQVGLIITGHAYVQHPLGRARTTQNAIYDDRFLSGYQRLADTVHPYGAKLVVQISHAGRQTTPAATEGLIPVAPSAVTDLSTGVTPRPFTETEIHALITAFVQAAARVQQAGADGVQVHIAHGYGLAQFLSPYTNRRTDQWGGDIANRTRIIREIVTRIRQAVGPDFPLLAKLNSRDAKTGPGYLSLDDVVYTAKLLAQCGVNAIEISGGMAEDRAVMSAPNIARPEQEAYFAAAARAVKAAVPVPVILVGGLRSLAVMERIVGEGTADLVALSRPLVREPDLVEKFRNGTARAACISCNACFNPQGLACYAN